MPNRLREKAKAYLGNSLYRNAFYLMVGGWVTSLLGFVFWIAAARYYTTEQVGTASALISAMQMLALLATLGFHIGIIRFLPDEKNKQSLINTCLTIPAIVAVILAFVFVAGVKIWTPDLQSVQSSPLYWALFVIFTVAECVFLIQRNIFIAALSSKYNLVTRLIANAVKLVLPIGLVFMGVYGIYSAVGISLWIGVFLSIILMRKVVTEYFPRPVMKKQVVNSIIRYSFGNYIAEFINALPNYILPLIVISLIGAELNAYFYIAFAMATVTFTIPTSISLSLFAECSNDPETIRENSLKAIKQSILLQIPVLIIIIVFGADILKLFGHVYSDNAYTVLVILSASGIPLSFIELYSAVNRVRKAVKPIILLWSLYSVIILGSGYILTDKLGLIGTSIGWLTGTVITAVVAAIYLWKWFSKNASK